MHPPLKPPHMFTKNSVGFSDANDALNYLFSSFVNRHFLHRGKHDREFRRPDVLIGLARKLNVLPKPSHTCIVTGSKGKGTVSRMVAWNLSATGLRVGLVLTPEEVSHLDRIRIGERIISERDFCRILGILRPVLDEAINSQPDDFYFAPTGIFLLVAMVWFREQGVDMWVIEGGRGAKFDEIGLIHAKIGIITNVLLEHTVRLGPTIENIAVDKLSLASRCETLIVGKSLLTWSHLIPWHYGNIQVVESPCDWQKTAARPQWLGELNVVSNAAVQYFCPGLPWHHFDTPAFFFAYGGVQGGDGRVIQGTVCCDAAIHPDCLDIGFLQRTGLSEGAALIGLSEDKDGEGILSALTVAGFSHLFTVGLTSRVRHIRAWESTGKTVKQVAEIEVIGNLESGLLVKVLEMANLHNSLYVVGVQVFIRSMRQVLKVGLMNPMDLV